MSRTRGYGGRGGTAAAYGLVVGLLGVACGDAPRDFGTREAVSFVADGEEQFSVELSATEPRRRFRLRVFSHLLHPRDVVSSFFRFSVFPRPSFLLRSNAGLQTDNRFGFVVEHRLDQEVVFEVEDPSPSESIAPLRVSARHTAPQTFGPGGQPQDPPPWDGSELMLEVEELDPAGPRLQPPPLTQSRLETRPSLPQSCRFRGQPSPFGAKDPSLRLSRADLAADGWVQLLGEGFEPGVVVRLGGWPAVEVERASTSKMRALPPLMAAGDVDITVENETTSTTLQAALRIELQHARELSPRPASVRAASLHGPNLFVGTASAVTIVSPLGGEQRLVFPPDTTLRDLRHLRDEPGHLVAATSAGVVRSQAQADGRWSSWDRLFEGDAFSLHEYGGGWVVAGGARGMALSLDGARTFVEVTEAFFRWRQVVFHEGPRIGAVAIDDRGRLWSGGAGSGNTVWAWQPAAEQEGFREVVQSPFRCGEWLASIGGALYVGNEETGRWAPHAELRVDRFARAGARLFAAGGGTLWSWEDGVMRAVARFPDGTVTALAVDAHTDRADVFIGRRHFVVSTRESS